MDEMNTFNYFDYIVIGVGGTWPIQEVQFAVF